MLLCETLAWSASLLQPDTKKNSSLLQQVEKQRRGCIRQRLMNKIIFREAKTPNKSQFVKLVL
jgi:hypothetical protein